MEKATIEELIETGKDMRDSCIHQSFMTTCTETPSTPAMPKNSQ